MKDKLRSRFADMPDALLSVLLLGMAALLVLIAMQRGHHLEKALALVWVILP